MNRFLQAQDVTNLHWMDMVTTDKPEPKLLTTDTVNLRCVICIIVEN